MILLLFVSVLIINSSNAKKKIHCDVVRDYGAKGNNETDDTKAIQKAIDQCNHVLLPKGNTFRVTESIALSSDLTIVMESNSSIFSDQSICDPHDSSCIQNPRCPTLYWRQGPTSILCGSNLTNVALIGQDARSSIIDGGGWKWYEAGVRNASKWGIGPRTFELTWSENITIRNLTFRNSPSWTIHPTFSKTILAENIRIENPRFTPNTDGFDPDSCVDVILRDSYIDTGDDGISIKSMNSTQPGSEHIMMPSKNIHIYNTKILSRNVCIGSATFGGVYDVVIEDCEIGDLKGSSPWAIKYKSHQNAPGPLRNHTWRRLRVGNISSNSYQQPNAGYFMSIELRYHPLIPNRTCETWNCPTFHDITFEDISVFSAQRAGDINGFLGDPLHGLTFRNVTFQNLPEHGWTCGYVDLDSFTQVDVSPPLKCRRGGDVPLV